MKKALITTLILSIGSTTLAGCNEDKKTDETSSTFTGLNGRIARLDEANKHNQTTIDEQGKEITLLKQQGTEQKNAFETRITLLQKAIDERPDISPELEKTLKDSLAALRKDIEGKTALSVDDSKGLTNRIAAVELLIDTKVDIVYMPSAPLPPLPRFAKPPMGWNAWNSYQCNVNETLVKETTDKIVANGMKECRIHLYQSGRLLDERENNIENRRSKK